MRVRVAELYAGPDPLQAALTVPAHRSRIQAVLESQHSSGQRGFIIFGSNAQCGLGDHRPRVKLSHHVMNSGPVQFNAGLQHPLVRIEPDKGWQQRGMNIHHLARPALDEGGRQNTKVARQHDQIGLQHLDGLRQRGLVIGTVRVSARFDQDDIQTHLAGTRLALGTLSIDDHRNNSGLPTLTLTGLRDRHHVRAAPGNQHHDSFHGADHNSYNSKFCADWPAAIRLVLPHTARCASRFQFSFHSPSVSLMQVFHRLPSASQRADCALTIGNFDGVHRGHQSVIARLAERARARGLPVSVLSFEPHPREYFAQAARGRAQANPAAPTASTPVRIQGLRDKVAALKAAGVHRLVLARFNQAMAALSAEDFVRDVLIDALRVRELMVGDDFRFGRDRRGDYAMLQAFAHDGAFNLSRTDTLADHEGRISSSAVRKALANGDLARVRDLLGRPYSVSGHVLHGRKLGRELGFPTLNLRVAGLKPALSGIFVVQVHGLASQALPGVASLGTRPAVEQNGRFLLETHVFDFSQTVYGRVVSVEFMAKLRDEANYPTLDLLRAQIDQDAGQARAWFRHCATAATHAEPTHLSTTFANCNGLDAARRSVSTSGAALPGDSSSSDNLPSRVL